MTIQLRRKPGPVRGWHLIDGAAMMDALTDLSELGWRGGITTSETGGLRLQISLTDDPGIVADVGDWIVEDLGAVRRLSAEQLAATYDRRTRAR